MTLEPVAELILRAINDEAQQRWSFTASDDTGASPNVLTITFRPRVPLALLGTLDIGAVIDCCSPGAGKVRVAWEHSWGDGPRLVINAGIFGRHTHVVFLLAGPE